MTSTSKSLVAAVALGAAVILFSGATEERLDIHSPSTCPAFAWPNSYSACLDDGVRPSGALQETEFAAAEPQPIESAVFN